MTPNTNDILRAHEQLFSAASGENSFAGALQTAVDIFGGVGGVVFELNRKTGAFSNWVGPGLEDGECDYINHLNAINPRMHYSLSHAPGHITYDHKFIDDRTISRHEFYDAIYRYTGVQYFLGSRIFDQGDISLFHSIEFTRQHGHPDAEKISSFRRLAPVIGNAWRLAARITSIAENQDLNRWTPDHLPWAIFALASNGTIVEMNSAASGLLGEKDILIQSDGALLAAHRNSTAGFLSALEQAMAGQTAETLLLSGTGAAPFAAQFVPVNSPHVAAVVSPSVLVYVWNPLHRTKKQNDVLARLYGFTTAEARLAAKLATGMDLNTAAEHLGITRNTARNQLQNLFAKTGTRRQSEFIARIIGVLES